MVRLGSIVLFCRDPYVMAPFWAAALGITPVDEDAVALAERTLGPDESVLLTAPGHVDVWISPVADLDPVGNRWHLDLDVEGGDVDRLLAAGARLVRNETHWAVLADPEGNYFCAVWPKD